VLGTLLIQLRLDWRSLAKRSQKCTSLWCTGLSGVHRTVSGAQAGSAMNSSPSRIRRGRYDYNSPDCPVCTGLSVEPTTPAPTVGSAISGRRVARDNGHLVAPDCVWCAKRTEGTTVGFARKGRRSSTRQGLFMSGGAPDCPVRHPIEGKNGLPNGSPTAPSYLGAIKGTPRRMEHYTKHSLNILRRLDSKTTHLDLRV
jgi:hypothetical protein